MSEQPVQPLPLDYASTRTTRTPGPVARFFLSRLGWPSYLIYSVLFVMWWFGLHAPVGSFGLLMLTMLGCMATAAFWFLRLILRAALARYFGTSVHYRQYIPWLVLPIIGAAMIFLARLGIPLKVSFALSKSAMQRVALAALSSGKETAPPQRAGLYVMQSIEVHPDGSVELECGKGFLETGGYIYSPKNPPSAYWSDFVITPLGDGWYQYRESF